MTTTERWCNMTTGQRVATSIAVGAAAGAVAGILLLKKVPLLVLGVWGTINLAATTAIVAGTGTALALEPGAKPEVKAEA